MQTERIAVALRPRDGWEAIDLGFRMVRTWWRPLGAAWLVLVWPLALAIQALLFDWPWLALLLIWWLKPLYDRVALHVLGEALFGDVPTLRAVLRALPSLLRTRLLASLTWLRFAPLRAVQLPILQLERLRGAARAERTRVLVGRDARLAVGLHLVCFAFELVLALGLLEALDLFAPVAPAAGDAGLFESIPFDAHWLVACDLIALSIVEPLYVAGGFGLYINRRVYLEGWDIDLAFRQLARRRARSARTAAALAPALLLLALAAAPAAAAENGPEPGRAGIECGGAPQDAGACIERILDTPEFATTTEISYWWPRGWSREAEEPEPPSTFWAGLGEALARLLRGLTWLGLAAAVAALAYWIARRPWGLPVRAGVDAPRDRVLLEPLAGEAELPDDVVAAARERWRSGDPSAALGLLYRAALRHLAGAAGIELPRWATEEECLRLAGRAEAGLARDFSALARAWQYCAYARRPPEEADFLELCRLWQPRLGVAP